MPFCSECGAVHAPNETFCGECGIVLKQVLANVPAPEHEAISALNVASNASPAPAQNVSIQQAEGVISSEPIIHTKQPSDELISQGIDNEESDTLSDSPQKIESEKPLQLSEKSQASTEDISEDESQSLLPEILSENVNQNVGEQSVVIPTIEAVELPKPVVSQPVIQVAQEKTPQVEIKEEKQNVIAQSTSPKVFVEPVQPKPEPKLQEPIVLQKEEPKVVQTQNQPHPQPHTQNQQQPQTQSQPKIPTHQQKPVVEQAISALIGKDTGEKRRPLRQLREGTILNNRYEIVKRIGGGGMGAVYLAKDRNLGGAPRAVKEMLQSHLDESQQVKAVEDFKRESLLLTSLEHVSIPTIYDYFYDEFAARFYLVMKYISGGDIAAHLRNAPGGRVDELTVARWGMETADVLDYLHNQQPPIIYRDLKPANLMVDGNSGRIMLIDFGIARWVNKEEKGVTAVGTMGYAPPELFSGKVEPRSDVYSLGATMFHLLTGNDPQDNPLLIFDFTKNSTPRQLNPAMSVEVEAILMRAVEYKPENRFRSASEFRDVLRFHLDKLARGELTYTPIAQRTDTAPSVEMVFCGFCGGRIAADDMFCAHCGKAQPLAGVGGASAQFRPRATAKLVVAGTTEIVASEFALQKDSNLIGRCDPQSNIFPEVDLTRYDPDTKVSRRHARIWRQGDTYLVEDLGSVNGTVVFNRSDKPMRLSPHQPHILQSGDRLRLGETLLHFFAG